MSVVLNELSACDLDPKEMVKLSQRAENEFMGMNCGIMDQFAVGMGKKDMAVFLNCKTLEYEYVPLELKDCRLVIANTNKRRSLTDSKYNQRRAECEEAVKYLNRELNIQCLGDLSVEDFESHSHLIPDAVISKRAEHIVRENKRVLTATDCLKEGNLDDFGKLMNESHASLRDLYEVTGFELDTLVEEAWKLEGVIGSRMTGAGFGGCTVSIVKEETLPLFREKVGNGYRNATGLTADFYIAETGDGKVFPRETIREAQKIAADITPELLESLDYAVQNASELYDEESDYFLHTYAMFLLAEFREKKAFTKLIAFLRLPEEHIEFILGDRLTEDFSTLLCSTFDGESLQMLKDIIEDRELFEYARSSAIRAYELLYWEGFVSQEEIIEFYRSLINDELVPDESHFATALVDSIINLRFTQMIPEVCFLYDNECVDTFICGRYDSFIDDMYSDKNYRRDKPYINDTIKDMEWWASFEDDGKKNTASA
ncbi:mevalonate kinase/galactokinase [Holotrichia oblita]|nr:mevalonate kinase/galactokinase [Holotrichia oblita]